MAAEIEDYEIPTSVTDVLTLAIGSIIQAGDDTLTHSRGVVDPMRGYVLRALDDDLSEALKVRRFVETRPAVPMGTLIDRAQGVQEGLERLLDFVPSRDSLLPEPFRSMAEELLRPTYTPGEPCRAPAPLLRDLLDIALGRVSGVLDQAMGKVESSIDDYLFPAFGSVEDLTRDVQTILEDPVTAILNLILGQRAKIECVTDAKVGVGVGVIETGARLLEKAVRELLS